MNRLRQSLRPLNGRRLRRTVRGTCRRCFRPTADRHRGPDELSQALTACRRALGCHRRLARIAPRFFDPTTVDRENYERAELRRRMETWEPLLAKAYGVPPDYAAIDALLANSRPPLPSRRTQLVVERELAGWESWLASASLALTRYRQRRPHALPSLSQIARLLELGFAFRQIACGTFQPDSTQAAAEARVESDLRRAYPEAKPAPPADSAAAALSAAAAPHAGDLVASAPPAAPCPPPKPDWPPPDDLRDLAAYALVRGEHGLLCLQRIEPNEAQCDSFH